MTNDVLKQWAKDFEAAHISVDDCMADSSGWIVVTVLIPIAVAVLFVGGFFGAKAWKKRRQASAVFHLIPKMRGVGNDGAL